MKLLGFFPAIFFLHVSNQNGKKGVYIVKFAYLGLSDAANRLLKTPQIDPLFFGSRLPLTSREARIISALVERQRKNVITNQTAGMRKRLFFKPLPCLEDSLATIKSLVGL